MVRLDRLRISFLTDILAQILGSKPKGETAALLLYSAIVGSLTVHPPLSMASLKKLFREFFHLYGIRASGRTSTQRKGGGA